MVLTEQEKKSLYKRYYERKSRCKICHEKNFAETSIQEIPVPDNGNFYDMKNKTYCNNCQRYFYIDELIS